MSTRTSERLVTFNRPFTLSGLDAPQPPGTYRVVVDEAEIHGLSFMAYQRTATMLHTPAVSAPGVPAHPSATEVYEVDPDELAAAVAADEA